MNKSILIVGVAAIALTSSCGKTNSSVTNEAGEASSPTNESVNYTVDIAASSVQWTGLSYSMLNTRERLPLKKEV